jgi:hypothetical protein
VDPRHAEDFENLLVLVGQPVDLDPPFGHAVEDGLEQAAGLLGLMVLLQSFLQPLQLGREPSHRLDIGQALTEVDEGLLDTIEVEVDLPVLFQRFPRQSLENLRSAHRA